MVKSESWSKLRAGQAWTKVRKSQFCPRHIYSRIRIRHIPRETKVVRTNRVLCYTLFSCPLNTGVHVINVIANMIRNLNLYLYRRVTFVNWPLIHSGLNLYLVKNR